MPPWDTFSLPCLFIPNCSPAPSARLQPHPVLLPSDPAGTYHHVPARHRPQGYCTTGGRAGGTTCMHPRTHLCTHGLGRPRSRWLEFVRSQESINFLKCALVGYPIMSSHCHSAVCTPVHTLFWRTNMKTSGPLPITCTPRKCCS